MEGSVYRNPRDGKSWRLQWDEPGLGKRRRRTKVFRGTKRDAEKLLRDILSSIDQHKYVGKDKQTFGIYLKSWLEDVVKLTKKPTTHKGYREKCKYIFDRDIASMPIQQLTTQHLQAVVSELSKAGLSGRTIDHFVAVIHNALNQAVRSKLLTVNPATEVKKPRVIPPEVVVWDSQTIKRFLEVGVGAPYFDAYRLILYTGLRRSEICGLRWSAVDLERGGLLVARTRHSREGGGSYEDTPKSRAGRRAIELTEGCIQLLRRIQETQQLYRMEYPGVWPDDPYVICRPNGEAMRVDNLDEQFLVLIRKYGLPHTTLHKLRHCHATMLNEQGFGPKELAERMGHSSVLLTMDIYTHIRPGAFSDKLKGLDDLL